jgi:hypothetical protein
MPETLLTPSGIKLYGRAVDGLTLAPPQGGWAALGYPGTTQFLKAQLAAAGAQLARIYGFSFEGHYYDLPKPAIFLVHTAGIAVDQPRRDRSDVDTSGVIARDWEFASNSAANPDLKYWEYDKGDFSIRLDIETGPFEQILLEAALRGGSTLSSGADLRSSGADLRSSGADLRISGADLRSRR